MKRLFSNLLFKVFLGILLGIVFGLYLPESINRIFATFNSFFGEFLNFAIPLIIMGLIMPAISDLGKGAGKLLLLTTGIAYGSTPRPYFHRSWKPMQIKLPRQLKKAQNFFHTLVSIFHQCQTSCLLWSWHLLQDWGYLFKKNPL